MKILLVALKVIFLLGYLGYLITLLSVLFPISISSLLLLAFAIYLAYPSSILLKSFFKENPEQNRKSIKQSLIFTLLFSLVGPIIFFMVLSLPFSSQAFEVFALPIIIGVGLIASFFLSAILVTYQLSINQTASNQTSETPTSKSTKGLPALAIIVLVVVTILLLALALLLSSFRLEGSY